MTVDGLDGADLERIRDLITAAIPDVAPAAALSIWHRGEPVLELSAGWMDPETEHIATPGDALFDLASITKVFTATAFLGLVSDGLVRLDDPVVSVIPEFAMLAPRAIDGGQEPLTRALLPVPSELARQRVDPAEVTFAQLLTHTSGMAPWRSIFREAGPVPAAAAVDAPDETEQRWQTASAALYGYRFVEQPGKAFRYSDLGFMALGDAVARLSGSPLDEAIDARVAGSLALETIAYRPLREGVPVERIVPTSFDDDWRMRRCHGEVEDENAAGLGGVAGHAGLFGTAHDVAAFGQAWLRRDRRLGVDAGIADLAVLERTGALGAGRGLGWVVQADRPSFLAPLGPGAYGHTGFTGTSLAIDPGRQLVLALLTDRVYAGRRHPGIDELRLELHTVIADIIDG